MHSCSNEFHYAKRGDSEVSETKRRALVSYFKVLKAKDVEYADEA